MRVLAATLMLILSISLGGKAISADIFLLGEVHDNSNAHQGQADLLRDIQPTAVVFEMLSPEEAERANTDRSTLPEIWGATGWPDYALYAPIFEALGDAKLVGAASSKALNKSVFHDGPAKHFGADATAYGLVDPLEEDEQEARENLQFDAHCQAMPKEMMGGMVNVQRFWDARFAKAAMDAIEVYGPPIAVIAGNGHIRTDWGIPAYIKRVRPELKIRAIAFVEGDTASPFDQVNIVPEAEREDPCAAFKDG